MNLQMSPQAAPDMSGGISAGVARREAVTASVALKAMKTADIAAPEAAADRRRVGAKEFVLRDGVWTDSQYDAARKITLVDLAFGSEALLKAIAADPQLASYASLGKNVVVVHHGKVYRIHG
jgi:hypothetical protein